MGKDINSYHYLIGNFLEAFLSADSQPTETEDDCPDRAEEYVMLGLRLSDGISLERLAEYGGRALADETKRRAERLAGTGLLNLSDGQMSLTERGFLLSNSVIAALLG